MTTFTKNNAKSAKLTASQVQDIRALYARGDCTQGELSRDFQVSVVQIGRIVRGEVWQSLPGLPPTSRQLDESARRLLEIQIQTRAAAAAEGVGALDKLQADARKRNDMLDELTKEGEKDAGYT